jgi:hypothetical protein
MRLVRDALLVDIHTPYAEQCPAISSAINEGNTR